MSVGPSISGFGFVLSRRPWGSTPFRGRNHREAGGVDEIVRAIVACVLAGAVTCAGTPRVDHNDASPPTVLITLDDRVHAGSWPTARAELGGQRIAFCPVLISTPQGSDRLGCDYVVGPLIVPEEYDIDVRAGDSQATVERTPTAILVDARWPDSRVSYRVDLHRGAVTSADPALASDTLRVVCDAHRTITMTPVVRAQPDGLRFSVEASEGVAEISFHHVAWEHGTSVGGRVGDGAFALQPGKILVACSPGPRTSYSDVEFATFELIDPDGLWFESGVDCDEVTAIEGRLGTEHRWVSYPRLGAHIQGAISGLIPGDEVRTEGYPEGPGSKLYLWDGLVIRDGARIAVMQLHWDGRLRGEVCLGSGLGLNVV
jgi:hypothetical protein